MRAGNQATAAELRRFHIEIEAAAALHHPHIVPIYDVGEHAGCPYYTMPVYSSALDVQLERYREPGAAAALLATVARAVHHGHERGVLHRDLKPANILLDDDGRPHVSDYGTAKWIDEPTNTVPGIGTAPYMAPEQVLGLDVTFAADVYSLGVVLYELVTGTRPFQGDTRSSILRAVLETEPVPLRARVPAIPRELEALCLKCLDKQPAGRYRSAEALADDLERFVRGDPVAAHPAGLAERMWRFARRHWLIMGAGVCVLLLLAVVAASAILVAHAQALELQRDALRTNAYAAHALAGMVAFHLREQSDSVVNAASDPAVVQLLRDGRGEALELLRVSTSFDSLSTYDRSGIATGHAPGTPRMGSDFSWRDYFIGARRLGEAGHREAYVSLPFLSEADGRFKFGIAAPVYDGDTWTDDAHRDPLPGFEGRWLAGFAPVGSTGFIVIVQTRHDALVESTARLWRRLMSQVGAAVLATTLLCAGLWGYTRHRRRAATARRGPAFAGALPL